MNLVFVHGWSVRSTDTYARLPERLARETGARVVNVWLGKYVSFDDQVTLDDLARAFDQALRDELGEGTPFAAITHSTGGPVVRQWMLHFHAAAPERCPLTHLVMLAPANHGSALAQLGASRLSRMKFFLEGVEPGERVLDWLELGSEEQWRLNERWLDVDWTAAGKYVFTLTGQKIDRNFYDHLNSYTGEAGSDGVIRVAAANPNYRLIRHDGEVTVRETPATAFGVLPGLAHCGERRGILSSVREFGEHPTVTWSERCLAVDSAESYRAVMRDLRALTARVQQEEAIETIASWPTARTYRTSRYAQILFRLQDDRGMLLDDYDLLFVAGPEQSPDHLPAGFCVDRQRNRHHRGRLTYYVDVEAMARVARPGFLLRPRPSTGLACYDPEVSFTAEAPVLRANETLMLELVIPRRIDAAVFRLTRNLAPEAIHRQSTGRKVA
jgi:hypothetical protein